MTTHDSPPRSSMTIHLIAAARPNFMKIAPVYHALVKEKWAEPVIVHTGQHYDLNMSDAFFSDLKLPAPHIHLGIGSGSHAEQTGNVMIAYEKILLEKRPDLVIVVGDVNSTLACTLAAVKLSYPIQNSRFIISIDLLLPILKPASGPLIEPCRKRSTVLPPMPSPIFSGPPPLTVMKTCLKKE